MSDFNTIKSNAGAFLAALVILGGGFAFLENKRSNLLENEQKWMTEKIQLEAELQAAKSKNSKIDELEIRLSEMTKENQLREKMLSLIQEYLEQHAAYYDGGFGIIKSEEEMRPSRQASSYRNAIAAFARELGDTDILKEFGNIYERNVQANEKQ